MSANIPPEMALIEEEMRRARREFYNAAKAYGVALDNFTAALNKGKAEMRPPDEPHDVRDNAVAYYAERIQGAFNHRAWIRGVLNYFEETDRGLSWW